MGLSGGLKLGSILWVRFAPEGAASFSVDIPDGEIKEPSRTLSLCCPNCWGDKAPLGTPKHHTPAALCCSWVGNGGGW